MYEKYEKLRTAAGFTDYAVAKTLCFSQTTLSDWKAGRSTPKADKLRQIAQLLKCRIDDFFD